ncbi:hypothetical protein [Tabrizicola thermarum]|uniref:hypothetical protein n=1 Tax=Tabrizicola thermarum TaxID=2670345 RepID=UPI000FFC62F3|nr:hypothetical protein [Tabrizicola thermarum]
MEKVAAALYGLDLLFLLAFQVMNRDQPPFAKPVREYGLCRPCEAIRLDLSPAPVTLPSDIANRRASWTIVVSANRV